MLYNDDLLDQINNTDLVNYIAEQSDNPIELEEKPNGYWGHCTRHIDDTPSFCVRPNRKEFHCFSCGRGGYLINYLKDYEDLTYDDAVNKGIELAGVDSSKICKSDIVAFLRRMKADTHQDDKKKIEHPILDEGILKKYRDDLPKEWLSEGIQPWVMKRFGVRIDSLHNRIIYPVRDATGRLFNIKARTMEPRYKELGLPKYISYYKNYQCDYFEGLDQSLEYVKNAGEIIIFEGIKSVMLAWGWGYRNCAAAGKHTLTKDQITLLIKLRVNVIIAYDSDVDYCKSDVVKDLQVLKRMTNVYVLKDIDGLLGGAQAKRSPTDMGREIFEKLLENKQKII